MEVRPIRTDAAEHLSAETLAVLAERGAHTVAEERGLGHLARCRSCMAAYADAVRYRAAWLASPELFDSERVVPHFRPTPTRRAVRWLPLAAGLIATLGITANLAQRHPSTAPTSSPAIARFLASASGTDLVYPGGEPGAIQPSRPYRAGSNESRAVDETIDALRQRYEQGSRSATDLYTLSAALTAAGRTDLAHDYVSEGRVLHPEHSGFLVLAAMLARRQGDPEQAERLLRQARVQSPRDLTVMLDHAIVLTESGATAEASELLRQVIRRAAGSPLALRAERVMKEGAPR